MTTTKHTPGPWTQGGWIDAREVRITGADRRFVVRLEGLDTKSPESQANARLIAAAPDLLKVLQAFIDGGYDRETAITAIAKATGEQP